MSSPIDPSRNADPHAEQAVTDVGPASIEGDVLAGRPGVVDRQPPAADAGDDDASGAAGAFDYSPANRDQHVGGPSRSLLATAVSQALRSWSARLGLVWIVLLLLLATFAPFLANSRPVLARTAAGELISPLWDGLTAADIALPLLAILTIALVVVARRLRVPLMVAAATFAGLVVLSGAAGYLIADPPLLERYSQYRRLADPDRSGGYQWSISTPIPFSPDDLLSDLGNPRIAAPWWQPNERAENLPTDHWLGTTVNGEDMASRMIHATRVALGIGIIATGIATLIGIAIGAVMGYAGGIVDLLLMRGVEILQALPVLVVLMIVTQFFGKDIWLMMVALGLLTWTSNARFIRAEFLRLRKLDFVQAARAAGLPTSPILFRHMLPNGVAPVLVNASFGIAGAILFESILSFLGLGLEAKDPSWGQLLNQARSGGTGFNWWIAIFPGLAIFLTVFAYILIGESLRDAIDPKLKRTEG